MLDWSQSDDAASRTEALDVRVAVGSELLDGAFKGFIALPKRKGPSRSVCDVRPGPSDPLVSSPSSGPSSLIESESGKRFDVYQSPARVGLDRGSLCLDLSL